MSVAEEEDAIPITDQLWRDPSSIYRSGCWGAYNNRPKQRKWEPLVLLRMSGDVVDGREGRNVGTVARLQ